MNDQAWVDAKRSARMASVDALSPEVRALVHEYGLNVVNAFLSVGVGKPRHIRHLVNTVLDEFSPSRGAFSCQGIRTPPIATDAPKASPRQVPGASSRDDQD